ncbi:unnamed protein product, partial [Mesorhabditis belari]|uniref:Doublecortin domain-containing protein n=1 Tax=Mesorhabditis belari TaxID=2138241 RepID=A0AAF3EZQ2_9BILA
MTESSLKKKRSSSLKRRSGKAPRDWTGGGGVPSYALADTKRIHVFRNGDIYHPGIRVVVNPRQMRDMAPFLDLVNQKLQMIAGARKLFTTGGKEIKRIADIENDKEYVASPGPFTPLPYGQTLVRSASSFITSMTSTSLASQLARSSRSSEPRKSNSESGGKRKRPKSQAPPGTAPADLSSRVKRAVSVGEKKIKNLSSSNGESTTKKLKKKIQNGVNTAKKTSGDAQNNGKKVVKKMKKKAQNAVNGVVKMGNDGKDHVVEGVNGMATAGGAAIGAVGGAIGGAVSGVFSDKDEEKEDHEGKEGHHEGNHHENHKESDKDDESEKENDHEKDEDDVEERHHSRRHSKVSVKSTHSEAHHNQHESGREHSEEKDDEEDDEHDEKESKAESDDSKRTQTIMKHD